MNDRKEFESFMFSMEGHNLYTKINSAEMSANRFAWEIWQAAPLAHQKKVEALEIQVQELRKALGVLVRTGELQMNDDKYQLYVEVSKSDIRNAKKALSTTINPDEWVRRDRLELITYFNDNGVGESKERKVWQINHANAEAVERYELSPLYRIKGE